MLWPMAVELMTLRDTKDVVICILLVVAIATLLVHVLINIAREHHPNRETTAFFGTGTGIHK